MTATLSQIIAAGAWTRISVRADEMDGNGTPSETYATVTNAEGDRFSLHASTYRNKVTASAAAYDADTVRANSSDIGSALRAGDASSSLDQEPAKIAASLARRVLNNPAFIAEARAIRAVFDERTAQRQCLREGIAKLQAMGYHCAELREGETVPMYKYHQVTLYRGDTPTITLYGNGRVSFEAHVSTDIDGLQFAHDTLAQLKGE